MGVIIKQSIKGTFVSYLGAALGTATMLLVFPKALKTDEIGLIATVWAYVFIFSQVFSLGFTSVVSRLFPYFRNPSKQHNGFLNLGFLVSLLGILIGFVAFVLYIPYLKESADVTNPELNSYLIWYTFPVVSFAILLNYLDIYFKALYNATIGIFLKDGLNKLLNLIIAVLYWYGFIAFDVFLFLYFFSYCLSFFILFIMLLSKGEFVLQMPDFKFINKYKREIISIGFFGIISGFSLSVSTNLDRLMIHHFLGYSSVGIYHIASFFGVIILMPSRSLSKISNTVIAESWKINDLKNIKTVYLKSSITLFAVGLFIFLGIVINMPNVIDILGPDYQNKGVELIIFILGLANLIEMSSGVSKDIIVTGKDYRYSAYFTLIMVGLVIVTNYMFIFFWGLIGVAFATFLSLSITIMLRLLFIKNRYKMQPYSFKHFYLILIGLLAAGLSFLLPNIDNPYFDILLRSTCFTAVYGVLVYLFSISEEINTIVDILTRGNLKRVFKRTLGD